jgi:GT2 family glycosyltransferase
MPYEIFQIEMTRPLPDLNLGPDRCGAAFVLRREHRPAGFFLLPRVSGPIPARELEQLIAANAPEAVRPLAPLRPARPLAEFPSLTAAICTVNRQDMLARTIAHLVNLQLPGPQFEIIVVDNTPAGAANEPAAERTRSVVNGFPSVRYVREKIPGLNFGRNRAVRESSGELIAYLDDDVIVDRWWLEGLRRAWAEHPEAGIYSGPILPWELETDAQIMVERRGGYSHSFERRFFGQEMPGVSTYPCGDGCFGAGANMVIRRLVWEALGGFDPTLDSAIIPGGGDTDMYYRVIRADYGIAYEPEMLIFHHHRRDYDSLRRQTWSWGAGWMSQLLKAYATDPSQRSKIRRVASRHFTRKVGGVFASLAGMRRYPWPVGLAWSELRGMVFPLAGGYCRAARKTQSMLRAEGTR